MTRILIVEDEPRIASLLVKGLEGEGFTTVVVDDGNQAADAVLSGNVDLVLLDVGLPGTDGLTVLREVRARGARTPVILLTARAEVPDRVDGLDAGADDYLTKPFSVEELLARIRVRLRESSRDTGTTITVGRIHLDLRTRLAAVGGHAVQLTAQECMLAENFLRNPSKVLSRDQLRQAVWGSAYDSGSNIVDVYVGYLRRKFGRDFISTVRGQGYRFDP